ncbi:hypothetical protein DFP72DRAFT_857926 [Ephemerocybe angulata]|uniref:Uncharacterized protein n=1 Tax=Ephemerocybe angulata TaxID=980116 RepID=A0A8H6HBL6_9AGAR|nr:hypothetical protein DFP72DRAFT_857926 [Tulosesus angulatus]
MRYYCFFRFGDPLSVVDYAVNWAEDLSNWNISEIRWRRVGEVFGLGVKALYVWLSSVDSLGCHVLLTPCGFNFPVFHKSNRPHMQTRVGSLTSKDKQIRKKRKTDVWYQANPARPDPFKYFLDGVKLD